MLRAWSVESVRAAEHQAMAGLATGELMQRAAQGLAQVALARLKDLDEANVVALVGKGDNGGDTLYAAGLLAEAGFACVAVLVSDGGRAAVHAQGLETAEASGVGVVVLDDGIEAVREVVAEGDLVLDGIFGIGARPGLPPRVVAVVEAIDDTAWVIAVDVASGLDPDGLGASSDVCVADETVTFGTPKPAHLSPTGEPATGRLTVVDIGVDLGDTPPAVERLSHDDVAGLWPVPSLADDKYSRGVLGVVAGGEAYAGAAVLCVTAAVEAGAGMVRYVGTPTPTALVRAAVPEAVMGEGRVQAWLIGPGLDIHAEGDEAAEQLRVARAALASDLPVVIDAGGLDLLELGAPARAAPTLITPHAGEAARLMTRLFGQEVTRADVAAEPMAIARDLAGLARATVLLKGATTLVVGFDDTPVRSQSDAPAWLATAGAGDVLAGLLGMLLASGLSVADAASLGALVHGVAAQRASGGGPLRAQAVASGIPAAVRDLLHRAGT